MERRRQCGTIGLHIYLNIKHLCKLPPTYKYTLAGVALRNPPVIWDALGRLSFQKISPIYLPISLGGLLLARGSGKCRVRGSGTEQ